MHSILSLTKVLIKDKNRLTHILQSRISLMLLPLLLGHVLCVGQNVGIGTNNPTGPLSFASNPGNKIVLWGDGNQSHYGLGIQGGALQIYANQPADIIAFGTGKSEQFTERMRIINSGFDGMQVNGRIILRNGTNPLNIGGGAGVWFTKADNSALLGFVGAQNNQNIGFFGGPTQWGFTYNALNGRVGINNNNPNAPLAFAAELGKKITLYPGTLGDAGFGMSGNRLQIYADNPNADVAVGFDAAGVFNERFAFKPNGALAVQGNLGAPGQVLTSNGNAGITWNTIPGFYNQAVQTDISAPLANTGAAAVDVPGLVANFTLSSAARVVLNFRVTVQNSGCLACGDRRTFVQLVQNVVGGTVTNTSLALYIPNSEMATIVSGPIVLDLPAGTYSYKVNMERSIFGTATVRATNNNTSRGLLTWQIYPQ